MPSDEQQDETLLAGGGRNTVHRRGDVVLRTGGPWSATVLAFLRHLEHVGFEGAPRVVGSGFDETGRETLSFVEGSFVHPGPWPEDSLFEVGALLARLHKAGADFVPPTNATWRPWFGRELGNSRRIFGHCDFAPWNIVAREGRPVALIDWETAGPVDALIELGQACWLNANLHDDGAGALGAVEDRVRGAAAIAEGYSLVRAEAAKLTDAIIDVAVADAADQAIEAQITPEGWPGTQGNLWGLAWRARAAGWMVRHRVLLAQALAR